MARRRDVAAVLRWADVPDEAAAPLIRRKVLRGRRIEVVRYRYLPGAVFPVHAHPEEQWTFVLRGRIVLRIGRRRAEAGPGDAVRIPGGVPHGLAVPGRRGALTLNVFSPPRKALPRAR